MLTKNSHMSYSDRQIIETGIENGSTKQAIATTLGKDKSTIGKEIKLYAETIAPAVMTNIDTLPLMHRTTIRRHLHLHGKVSMRQ